jgi:hypothetical protein
MAKSTAPMLLTTGMSFGNQWLGNGDLDLKILVAGAIATGGLALLEQAPGIGAVAPGIAWIAFITLMFTRLNGKPSPIDNISKLTGL